MIKVDGSVATVTFRTRLVHKRKYPEFVIESVGTRFNDSARAKILGYIYPLSINAYLVPLNFSSLGGAKWAGKHTRTHKHTQVVWFSGISKQKQNYQFIQYNRII
jgi:hypothetical protein